jgi:Ser/Thr protein kinase RdoA (MazF antagonist)
MTYAAQISDLNLSVKSALAGFGIVSGKVTRLRNATRCAVFKIEALGGTYALKLYPKEYGTAELGSEIEFVRQLKRYGCSVPQYRTAVDGALYVTTSSGMGGALYEWVQGRCLSLLDDRRLTLIVELLGAIHEVGQLNSARSDDWVWTETAAYLKGIRPPCDLKEWMGRVTGAGRPWSTQGALLLCHGDCCPKNILWPRGSPAPVLIDFTNSISAPAEWELAVLCSDVVLYAANPTELDTLSRKIAAAYVATGRKCSFSRLQHFLSTAIVQRAILRAITSIPSEQQLIWQRLRRAKSAFTACY